MSAVYPKFREQLLSWALNGAVPVGLTFKVIGVRSTYVYGAAHNDIADVDPAFICIPEASLSGVTILNGVVDATDADVSGADPPDALDALIIYLSNGVATYLAAYLDGSTDASIPGAIDSTTGTIRWNASGIFKA